MNMSGQILEVSKYEQQMHIRVAGIMDLFAAEGKYHPNCLKKFLRDKTKAKHDCKQSDLAMVRLVKELKHARDNGYV